MTIGNAVKRGDFIYVYNEKGRQIFSVEVGSGDQNGIHGYTGGSVSTRRGEYIYTYDDTGHQISSTRAG